MKLDPQAQWTRLHDAVWRTDPAALPRGAQTGLGFVRTLWVVLRDLQEGQLNLRAMSLVYTTILSLVPLLAVSFSVLKGFGVHEQLEVSLTNFLEPLGEKGQEIGNRIIGFVENVQAGVLGSVGLALLIWTVVSLMQKIEGAFNFIWHVPQDRPFAQRFSGYLSVIIIGPVLIFSSAGITASLASNEVVAWLSGIQPFGEMLRFAGRLVPYLMVVGAFTFFYLFMPNTRVNVRSALIGALVAGLAWYVAGWAFASFVATSANYTAIYSAFAALIVFMLWLYVGWLVLLVGAAIAFYHQHPEHRTAERVEHRPSPAVAERLGLLAAALIVAAWRRGRPPLDTDALARCIAVPGTVAERAVRTLDRAGLIACAVGKNGAQGWVPACPPEQVALGDLLRRLREDGTVESPATSRSAAAEAVDKLMGRIEAAHRETLGSETLADLATAVEAQEQDSFTGPGTAVHHLDRGAE